jgi:RNA polymerase sigma-70 factor (ECF subfamily)
MSAGDLASLYSSYGPMIYSRCRRVLDDDAAAEDATQETFMRVQRHLQRAPHSLEALVWIYRVATNYCLNEIRNRRLHPVPVDVLPDLGTDVAELLGRRDLAARLIEHAPEKLRAPAYLHYVDGLDQSEVARVLGISRRTVVYRLSAFAENARKFVQRAGV